MTSPGKWTCDGVPKNNDQTYNGSGAHPEWENTGPYCDQCGLPREAMNLGKTQPVAPPNVPPTKVSTQKSPWLGISLAALLLLGLGGGLIWYLNRNNTEIITDETQPIPSPTVTNTTLKNPSLISQGEEILIQNTNNINEKQAGADAFSKSDWNVAGNNYEQAVTADPNDPEATIYLNNTKAQKQGNPLTIAVIVPITPNANQAKEILRGVASAQDDFNKSATGSLLEIIIVNDDQTGKTSSLAEDLSNYTSVLAVLDNGASGENRQAIAAYEKAGLAVLSPISVNVIKDNNNNQSILKSISVNQPEQELLDNYIQTMSKTLANYAAKENSAPSVALFYNSDNSYSQTIKNEFTKAISSGKGQIALEMDVTNSSFNPAQAIKEAQQKGFNTILFALSSDKEQQAIDLAKEAAKTGKPLTLIGSSQLYTPTILINGGDAIKGLVLAVPWSWQENDPFAKDAEKIWKGRISWRTTTARDVTQALANALSQNSSRSGIIQRLQQGIPIANTAIGVNIFDESPLVKAVPGSKGPTGSKYQFDPL